MTHIINPDSAPGEDILGRKAFAAQIVEGLGLFFGDRKESLVVGISGKWGSGKSTLLDYIQEDLEDRYKSSERPFKVIKFNSWGHTAEADLERSFLEKVLETVSKLNWKEKTSAANDKFKKYLGYLDYVKFAGHFHPVIKNMLEGAEEYRKKVNVVSLEEIKETANGRLEESGTRLYILIDDLDRLAPAEITALFRILKVNLNLSNTIFILAYDKQVIIQALEKEYGLDGEQYLEKIIQVDFHIPQISEAQMELLFFERLADFLKKVNVKFDAGAFRTVWRIHGLNEYFRSIRDLNRYFNNLVFSLPHVAGKVNLFDFLVLDAIKTFDAQTYHRLYDHITEVYRKGIWQRIAIDEPFIARYEKETTKALLGYLFVRQHSDDGNGNQKRFRDREYFERYFALGVPSKVSSFDLLENFFLKESSAQVVLAAALASGKLPELLGRLGEESLSGSHKLESLNVFSDFIEFFSSRSEPADLEEAILRMKAYFNLVRLFDDQHRATLAALAKLKLEKDRTDRTAFLFLHVLVRYVALLNLPKEVDSYIRLNADKLNENLLVYLHGHSIHQFHTLSTGSPNWVDNLFLIGLIEDDPEKYLAEFTERMSPKLIWFIVFHNLFVFKEGKPDGVIKSYLDLFFPTAVLSMVLRMIRETQAGQMREEQRQDLGYFENCIRQQRYSEPDQDQKK
ncbi:P-loop NTPase fold protein [Pedobacter sp. BMA]|uniref:KAP family P-loop NTPase fold protein n=1 Tax=Pedobacter sp. BMA TaxID=1663685 RepID=UPI000A4AC300|nr:P-loop NTPase fold protein [Pedobacter sp. BMA]